MLTVRIFFLTAIMAILLNSCAGLRHKTIHFEEAQPFIEVKVVSHGWHVGLILPVNEQFIEMMPKSMHVSHFSFVEVGWGDRDFYTGLHRGLWGKFKGAFLPTLSVVHVAAFNIDPVRQFDGLEMQTLYITEKGYTQLLSEFLQTFEHDMYGDVIPFKDGLYATALFYNSRRRYFLPRTSNTWIARLLKEAGLPFTPWLSTTSRAVMRQANAIEFSFGAK